MQQKNFYDIIKNKEAHFCILLVILMGICDELPYITHLIILFQIQLKIISLSFSVKFKYTLIISSSCNLVSTQYCNGGDPILPETS